MTDDQDDAGHSDDRWADLRTTTLVTGVPESELVHAMETGDVRFTMTLPSQPGVVMLHLDDARRLAGLHRLADEVFPHDPTD
jgi:hypothetical protein